MKAAALGNAMEWFDFGVYSYIAVTLGKVFFPTGNATAQLLSTFGAFAAAFLVRPLGGMVFGPLGDRVGRQKVLALTMIMMAAGTFAIGLIPSYAAIGVGAPILLLAARLVQGFSTGGEYAGASTFIAEYAPDKRRGFLGSWLEFGTLAGYIGGAGLVTLMTALLSTDDLLSWGWRIPFLIAGPMGIIGLYLRMRLEETPAFAAEVAKAETERPKVPLREMITGQWRRAAAVRGPGAGLQRHRLHAAVVHAELPHRRAGLRRHARPGRRARRDGADDGRAAVRGRADRPGGPPPGDGGKLRRLPRAVRA